MANGNFIYLMYCTCPYVGSSKKANTPISNMYKSLRDIFLAAMILFKISLAILCPGSSFSYSSNKKMKLISIINLSFFYSSNFRPSLTRAETIESCNSDDLVTVLEMHNRKPYKIIDRKREVKKGVMAETLDELVNRGKILQKL